MTDADDDGLHIPADAGECTDALRRLLLRIPAEWGRSVGCDRGWYRLICELDSALGEIDPDYRIHQVKQKVGRLRMYFHTDHSDRRDRMNDLIHAAEARSAVTCELCGSAGVLHGRAGGGVRTLCAACAAAGGWEPIGEDD